MPSRLSVGVAVLALAALSAGGCSWAFVNGPPPGYQHLPYVDCTSSNALPTLDVIISAIGALDAVGMLADGTGGSSSGKAEIGLLVGEAAAFGASAVYGSRKTAACRAAEAEALTRAGLQVGFPLPAAPVTRPPYDPWIARPPAGPGVWEPPAAKPPAPPPADASDGEDPDGGTDAEAAP
jgi:hypothetical protein